MANAFSVCVKASVEKYLTEHSNVVYNPDYESELKFNVAFQDTS